jgi:hypothetical protein
MESHLSDPICSSLMRLIAASSRAAKEMKLFHWSREHEYSGQALEMYRITFTLWEHVYEALFESRNKYCIAFGHRNLSTGSGG